MTQYAPFSGLKIGPYTVFVTVATVVFRTDGNRLLSRSVNDQVS